MLYALLLAVTLGPTLPAVPAVPYDDVKKHYLEWDAVVVDGTKLRYQIEVRGNVDGSSHAHSIKFVHYSTVIPILKLIAHRRSTPGITGLPSPGIYTIKIRAYGKDVRSEWATFAFEVSKPQIKNVPAPEIRLKNEI